ncbi:PrpF domain-containing protein [Cellvibrio fibrivorans]|uniref:2-methylaconitate cis-trans-isomerase PrpF n=1 Tax=Cellvibrio fibrivorans TaxID=126350 RepID=A0ABU1V1Y5_9GAMM|nr:PrpF domain-containing protein [Cellvibrio fibrivorans]MDR7091420.1 2-methylaconitate cis-trans-isomerase PrpF [Cellvibrio fibrivorans]
MTYYHPVSCAVVRGGTTKGLFINTQELPSDKTQRDAIILTLMGSPDLRQINGLGGGDPLTSKVALIKQSDNPDVDVEYLSGEVGIDEGVINYSTMCGNLASGVGIFALATGLIAAQYPHTKIRIRNMNTGKKLEALIPMCPDLTPLIKDCREIDGVQGAGSEIQLTFIEPGGSITGEILPSGKTVDTLTINNKDYRCSIVDCGTLYAFFPADQFNLTGDEQPELLDLNEPFKDLIEQLRESVAGLISQHLDRPILAKQIKIAIYADFTRMVDDHKELTARVINRYKTHKAFPVTGAICISTACVIPGTLLNTCNISKGVEYNVLIKHSEGVISTNSLSEIIDGKVNIKYTSVNRSARIIMAGVAYA